MPSKQQIVDRAWQLLKEGEDEYWGICIECSHEQAGCEPDASKYKCEACGEHAVYGLEEIILEFGDL